MIEVTKSAQKYLLKLLNKKNDSVRIRVFVTHKGKSYYKCEISYCHVNKISSADYLKIQLQYLSLYLEKKSLVYLKNSKIDLVKNGLDCFLKIYTPKLNMKNESKNKDIFSSLENFLEKTINSRLIMHGGRVDLINITENMIAIIRFSGGCNGCAMSKYTFKNMIEKEIMNKFNKITGVIDITDHKSGSHSYA